MAYIGDVGLREEQVGSRDESRRQQSLVDSTQIGVLVIVRHVSLINHEELDLGPVDISALSQSLVDGKRSTT